jgi:3-dehydroquinate dehydratase/shikimate dehydrogenase
MICVSIGRGRHRHVIAEHRHLVDRGAQLVELRIDYLKTRPNLLRVLENRPCPVVITVRREKDGGRFRGTEQERRVLLRAAIASGVEYVDLEEDAAAAIPRYGKTKRIISFHDFRKTPDNLEEIHARLAALDPDIVKIATMANRQRDNLRMLQLVQKARVPTVGLCMGDIGVPSRILAGRFGAPFTYATFHHERALAPGQLSFDEMTNVYGYDRIGRDTEVYGVIADPVGHSLSPLIHNSAFRLLGLNKVYVPFRVSRGDLEDFLSFCRELGVRGLSVTIPHKERIVQRLTKPDDIVRGVGAANTVIFDGDELYGYNTDCQASIQTLQAAMDKIEDDFTTLRGRKAMVLGAGGAAKAVAFALKRLGADVFVSSRTTIRTEELADLLDIGPIEWEMRHTVEADVLVNCTPVGMHPRVDETPYDKLQFKPGSLVFDAVYNPENTLFIKEAREAGCYVVTGVDMFVRQAALQFKHFTGQEAPADDMRKVLKRATSAVSYGHHHESGHGGTAA